MLTHFFRSVKLFILKLIYTLAQQVNTTKPQFEPTAKRFEGRARRGCRIALLSRPESAMVGAGKDAVKKKKPAKKTLPKEPPLNLSGVKFEDAVRVLLRTPPLPKQKK